GQRQPRRAQVSPFVQSPSWAPMRLSGRRLTDRSDQSQTRNAETTMIKKHLLIGMMMATLTAVAGSQEPEHKYVAGIRSGLITGTMRLSGLDPAFDNLAPGGPTGPHMSGFFLMYKARPQLRIGVETLVASSDKNEVTTMNYQAA